MIYDSYVVWAEEIGVKAQGKTDFWSFVRRIGNTALCVPKQRTCAQRRYVVGPVDTKLTTQQRNNARIPMSTDRCVSCAGAGVRVRVRHVGIYSGIVTRCCVVTLSGAGTGLTINTFELKGTLSIFQRRGGHARRWVSSVLGCLKGTGKALLS